MPLEETSQGRVTGMDDLVAPFHDALTPRAQWLVGTEAEKFGLLADTLQPLPFDGPRSVRRVLELFVERHGWQEQREYADGAIISLTRDAASITLEPAGQLELSGAPFPSVHQACAEFSTHLEELRGISAELNVLWLSLGFHPFATHDELPHVPKARYAIMRRYMPTRGARSQDMMRRTCTVQANLDFDTEADAIRKLRVALALQPVVTAMFANSPLYEGRIGPHLCERAATWLEMDRDRSGILPFAWESDMSFERYVEWALDVPMFMIKRDARVLENTGQTFRQFMADGYEGTEATRADWETHLNTLFPEARLKRTLEVRGVDAQPNELVCAVPALWKGLLYDDGALARAESLVSGLDAATVQAARPDIARVALRARLAGREVSEWAMDTLEIAEAGLERQDTRNRAGEDERKHLRRLRELLEQGLTPADVLLRAVESASDLRNATVEATRV